MVQGKSSKKSRLEKKLKAGNDKKVPLSVTISSSVKAELRSWCDENGFKESQAVNEILKDFLFEN